MKKLLLVAIFGMFIIAAIAQAERYLNLGGIGTGLYASYEIPLGSKITIAPQGATDWDFDHFDLSVKGNFYFDDIFGIGSAWDVYAGANVGWRLGNDNGANWGGQVGGRWFWSDRWGLNAEFGGGTGVTGGLGVTMKM